jgi:hypothetical protein
MFQLAAGASSTSGPAWPALFISIAGLILSLTALGWQVLVFARSGSRVRVEMKFGTFLTQNPIGFLQPGVVAAAQAANATGSEQPIYLPDQLVVALGPQNLQHLWMIAEISNIGRLAVTVQGCQWHTSKDSKIERRPTSPGVSFPHRLDANDQCIAVIDLHTVIAMLDAPFGGTRFTGREVWPEIRLGNRRTVKGKRIQIPVTVDPNLNTLKGEKNPELPFKLNVESSSNVLGQRDRVLVRGYIEEGSVSIGDQLELVSALSMPRRRGECIGVGPLNQPNQAGPQQKLVGVFVSGINEEDVHSGDILQGLVTNS